MKNSFLSIFLFILTIWLLVAAVGCDSFEKDDVHDGSGEDNRTKYVSQEYGYSIEYPKTWIFDQKVNEAKLTPDHFTNNSVHIAVSLNENLMAKQDSQIAERIEDLVNTLLNSIGASDVAIKTNQRPIGNWDWEATFVLYVGDTYLVGQSLFKETSEFIYIVSLIREPNWNMGSNVISTFHLV